MKRALFTTPQDAEAAFYDAFEKSDLDAMMGVWADDDDIVCVQLPNCVELPAVYLACLRLGIVVTPVPVQYREHELEHILGITQPRAIVTAARILHHDHAAMMRGLAARHPSVHTVLAIDALPRVPLRSRKSYTP